MKSVETDTEDLIITVLFVSIIVLSYWGSIANASFDYRPQHPDPQEPVVFEANHQNNQYFWNMEGKQGDQTSGEWERRGSSVSYTFSEPGTYVVTLKVTESTTEKRVTKRIHIRNNSVETDHLEDESTDQNNANKPKTTMETTLLENIWTILKRTDVVLGLVASILTIALYYSHRQ